MSFSGQFRPIMRAAEDDQPVSALLRQGLERMQDLSLRLQALDTLLLSGKPQEISEAAALVEAAVEDAQPAFAEIGAAMGRLGACNLAAAAAQLREIEQEDAAGLAEALRTALARFAKTSVNANRRAQQLNRGINAALKSLHALGVQDSGRLIAEA
jgi:hypothetical protein